jgi:hypothetical protein
LRQSKVSYIKQQLFKSAIGDQPNQEEKYFWQRFVFRCKEVGIRIKGNA